MSASVRQTSYDLMCRMLRQVLQDGVHEGPDAASGIGSVQFRATATLYELLLDHPIDRQGRCQSCRRPGAVLGLRRRRCRVHIKARHWLHHPDAPFLLSQLAGELGLTVTGTVATDTDATDVLPVIAADPPTEPAQTPVVPSPLVPRGPRGRGGRTEITAGPGSTPTTPGLAVAHPGTRRPVRVALCFSLEA